MAFGAPDRAGVDALAERLAAAGLPLAAEPSDLQTPVADTG